MPNGMSAYIADMLYKQESLYIVGLLIAHCLCLVMPAYGIKSIERPPLHVLKEHESMQVYLTFTRPEGRLNTIKPYNLYAKHR